MTAAVELPEALRFQPGDLIQAIKDCRSVTGDRIEAGRMYEVAALDRGGWPILSTDEHGGGGWAPGQFRRASAAAVLPPMVPVQRGIVEELRAAMAEYEAANAALRGQRRADVLAVVRALLDEVPE